ncbi:glycoside hydrolase family 2 protein, partial [Hyaloscypha hepaticicola]
YVYLSQLVQSEAMYYAFRGWRRLFEGGECGGALVWQMNDSWPVVSWATVDYYERPKMAFYAISRAMRPVATGVARKMKGRTKADAANVIAHATPHIYPQRESTYSVWVANASIDIRRIKIRIRFISVESGLDVREPIEQTIEAKATGTTEVTKGPTPEEEPIVVVSEIFDLDSKLLSYDVDWPQPLKHLTFPDRGLIVEVCGQEELVVSAGKPVKGLFFTNDGVQWSDNCLDVVPGQKLTIIAKGLKEK